MVPAVATVMTTTTSWRNVKFPRKHVSKMACEHTDPVCYLVLFRVVKTKVNGDHSVNADIRDVSFTI